MAVLFSFALVVAVVTLMVLTAVARVADYSNRLDEKRSFQTTTGALKTFQTQLKATLNDYAAWDDAAKFVYAPDGMDWVASNFGGMSANNPLFDGVIVVDESGKPVLAYQNGKPSTEPMKSMLDPAIWSLLDTARSAPAGAMPEAAGFIDTSNGVAVAGVALVRQKSGTVPVPVGQRRYLVFIRHLDADQIKAMADNYVINGLHLVSADTASANAVPVVDPLGRTLGKMVWQSSIPGDMSYQQARPLVAGALGLVGMFFVVLLMLGSLANKRLRAEEAAAREAALQDRLSGLLNREGMRVHVDQMIEQASLDRSNVLLLYLDLDGFKEINDSYGHGTGDQLIRAIAAGLKVLVPGNAILARLGGDEFAVAFPGEDLNDGPALGLAEQVLDFLSEPLEIGRRVIVVGASIGIAMSPEGRVGREEMVRRADLAMYKAKEAGRSRMMCYDSDMDTDREGRNAMELDLRAAIEGETLGVVYQPLVDAATHAMIGVEALVRWDRPGYGPISPEVFIPVAETSGLIEGLGLLVLRRACEAAVAWPGMRIAVNVSPSQFRNPAFADYVRYVLKQTEIDPERVTLEITEGYIIQNPKRIRVAIERLKALGVKVALDDFGSGFSSIGYLRQFGFDRIKIDKSLTMGVLEGKSARDMLQATVALARSLDIPVTAEGIETEEQGIAVRLFGCDELQGYFHGKPMTAADITKRYQAELRDAEENGQRVAISG
ncbi:MULTISPECIES: EAL domain-containing protein [Rhizobium]|uniref:EAL domain-containing protein n=2 Tax=Rhizobium/Agrobacterium group TaxID=227290 RepID=A0ABY8ILQ3_9HYPH|nr:MULTISPECIES: EAL domain-containing protein [Rhizobium]MBZ5759163.1 EAL domain-containing protein [Rhizobium sp. VS19-DR96]MBZ5764006.1 EAL domain-containing protein [Rhizobium sp. VS19-DR129.2]MBZ5771550.1 EAL domain-containing protein [Rhizobium sp. VS19-DRK62.2]MBZ5783763.1 EAL domain-containing protein [Rhizobium sp. VS19-DR121]MBZ5801563.1 EAL domain-containing protein [Rhizobium sp. VS19-DR181]